MKKNKPSRLQRRQRSMRHQRRRYVLTGGVCAILLLAFATLAGPWSPLLASRKRATFFSPAPVPSPSNPTKEYIYAGGRLIATEEPAPVTLAPPASMAATSITDSGNPPAPRVTISWTATPGAHHYEVEKTTNVNTAYSSVNTNVTGTSYTDTGVSSVTAYLYRVRAVDAAGNISAYSNIDLATAITFTDDTIIRQSTLVKAAHITELRQAVDAVRALANVGAANWGGAITPNSTLVQASHVQNLRTNLDAARSTLGLAQCNYTDNSIPALQASFINKDHIDQLRQCVR